MTRFAYDSRNSQPFSTSADKELSHTNDRTKKKTLSLHSSSIFHHRGPVLFVDHLLIIIIVIIIITVVAIIFFKVI
jgi:hypothetical protein